MCVCIHIYKEREREAMLFTSPTSYLLVYTINQSILQHP